MSHNSNDPIVGPNDHSDLTDVPVASSKVTSVRFTPVATIAFLGVVSCRQRNLRSHLRSRIEIVVN